MNIFPDDEFLAWFFTYFTGDAICPHCQSVIYEDEINEKSEDFIICPRCGKNISRKDIEQQ